MSVNRAMATATATGHRSTPSKSHSPGSGGASDSSNSRAATPIPMPSISKRGTIILGSGRGGGRRTVGGLPVLGRRSNLRFGTSPGTPPQHGNADGGTPTADVSHADRLAAELANTARELVFAQSDKMSVTFSEALPTEVRGVIGRGGTPPSAATADSLLHVSNSLQTPGTNHILAVMTTQPVMLGPLAVIPASCGSIP